MSYRTRRTIKPGSMDSSRPVVRELLLEILEDAHWAPTHGLTQPWRFHVFSGDARQQLAAKLQELYDELTPTKDRREDKREKLGTVPLLAPICIAIIARVDPNGKIPEFEEIVATSCAVQNLMLSAHERGLGTFWSTPAVACSSQFIAWLGLDESHRALGIVYLGYVKEGFHATSTRNALAEHLVFHE